MIRKSRPVKLFSSIGSYIWLLALLILGTAFISNPVSSARTLAAPEVISYTFYERTGGTGPKSFTFASDSSEITTRRSDPLGYSNNDFMGVGGREFYDVFHSDADGSFNQAGEFITVEAVFNYGLPAGGGLNIAEVQRNFAGRSIEFASFVTSFVVLGDNGYESTVSNAVDSNLLTHTTMGNTIGQTQRLRVTVGFTMEVSIDVRPRSEENLVNPRSNGKIPVAILTTESFDAASVDETSVRFGATGTEAEAKRTALRDVDADGDSDLLLSFHTRDTGIVCETTDVFLRGVTLSGQVFEGSDFVTTVGCN